ncbi:MAG: NifU N-terminal domain-containing protein [Tepidisphaeraceae bacterium]
MAYRVRHIEATPNPNAHKFILDKMIAEQPTSFRDQASADAAAGDFPLAQRLFQIKGVNGLLFLGDFVTINKSPEANWADISKHVRTALAEE